jgi:hypothetical protein
MTVITHMLGRRREHLTSAAEAVLIWDTSPARLETVPFPKLDCGLCSERQNETA